MLLGNSLQLHMLTRTGLSPSLAGLSIPFQFTICYIADILWFLTRLPRYPVIRNAHMLTRIRFRLFPLRSPLLRESFLLSLTRITKMFQFIRLPSLARYTVFNCIGFPIRTFAYHSSFAAPHDFSQLTTSFIGSYCLGTPDH